MDIEYIEKDGSKRKGIITNCDYCKIEFLTRYDQPAKFCSVNCKNEYSRSDRLALKCDWCGLVFDRVKSRLSRSRNGFYFCCRKCKDSAQRIGGIQEIMPLHYGTSKRSPESYRKLYLEYHSGKLSCKRCGYDEFDCGIDIHHINKDSKDNSKENLISLCAPCHRGLHKKLWSLNELK